MDEWIEPHLLTVSAQTSSSRSTPLSATPSTAPLRLSSPLALSAAQLPKKRSIHLDSAVFALYRSLKSSSWKKSQQQAGFTKQQKKSWSFSKQTIPQKTEDATKWAIQNVHAWVESRKNSEARPPDKLLEDMNPVLLNKWLAVFIAETSRYYTLTYMYLYVGCSSNFVKD